MHQLVGGLKWLISTVEEADFDITILRLVIVLQEKLVLATDFLQRPIFRHRKSPFSDGFIHPSQKVCFNTPLIPLFFCDGISIANINFRR